MRRRITEYLSEKQGAILMLTLGLVVLLFIGILITTYVVAKKTDPILLDESGRPVNAQ